MNPPVRPLAEVDGLMVSLWNPKTPCDAEGRRWQKAGFLSTRGPARGHFVYFRGYDGPPLDPVHLDYRRHPPGTPFAPPAGAPLFGVFRDALPGHFGMSLLESHFPEIARLDDLGRLAWFGRRVQSGLLFEPQSRQGTPERYIEGVSYLEAAREKMIRFQLQQMKRLIDQDNLYSLTSLGGARPKLAARIDGRYWVAKFNRPDDPYDSLARVEHAALRLAAAAGIPVPASEVRVLPRSSEDTLLVERYDRGSAHRAHRVSLRTRTGIDNAGVYGGVADMRDVGKILDALSCDGAQHADLIRRIAFMSGAGVADNHLGNFEMMLDTENRWVFTPAYDLVPVEVDADYATRLCGFTKSSQAVSAHLAPAVARLLGRPLSQVAPLIEDTWARMAGQFDRVVREANLSASDAARLARAVPVGKLATLGSRSSSAPDLRQGADL